jgi:predicted nuclease of predicted toxin-antitoxin system
MASRKWPRCYPSTRRRIGASPEWEIFAKAKREERTVLTFDLDFGEIVALSHATPVKVIVFRLHNARATHVIDRLVEVLSISGAEMNAASVILVEESRHRIRRFPFDNG